MSRTLIKGLGILVAFFGVWLLLAQIDFITIFKIKEAKSSTESGIGNIIWEQIEKTEDVVYNDSIVATLDSLLLPLCKKNFIERDSLKVHIIHKDEINAFAMPDNQEMNKLC